MLTLARLAVRGAAAGAVRGAAIARPVCTQTVLRGCTPSHAALFASPAAALSACSKHRSFDRLAAAAAHARRTYSTNEKQQTGSQTPHEDFGVGGHSGWRRASESASERNAATAAGAVTIVLIFIGLSYAAVPLYKIFCQMTGFGGTPNEAGKLGARSVSEIPELENIEKYRRIRIEFNADVSDKLPWTFAPAQKEVWIRPGETALAFFTAQNNSNAAITGVATYMVQPQEAAIYFSKVQCFCFDEQRLKPGEQVDMPVFFFVDPDFVKDRKMDEVERIMLSYTFFKAYDPDSPDEEIDQIPPDAMRGPAHGTVKAPALPA